MHSQQIDSINEIMFDVKEGYSLEIHQVDDTVPPHTHTHRIPAGKVKKFTRNIFPGVTVSHVFYIGSQVSSCQHAAKDSILEINYCVSGRIGWEMKNGTTIYLGPSDFSIHTRDLCADSVMVLPNDYYEGIEICIDVEKFDSNRPDLIASTDITATGLCTRFCKDTNFTVINGNESTNPIFRNLWADSHPYFTVHISLHVLELLLHLMTLTAPEQKNISKYQSEQIEIIRNVHDYLLSHLSERITIEDLSTRFLMNSTTIKTVFKGVYGDSLAAHIKEHRMEKAAELLTQSGENIAAIAEAVGYSSQSKFSTAFQEFYGVLPSEYRRKES